MPDERPAYSNLDIESCGNCHVYRHNKSSSSDNTFLAVPVEGVELQIHSTNYESKAEVSEIHIALTAYHAQAKDGHEYLVNVDIDLTYSDAAILVDYLNFLIKAKLGKSDK